MWNPYESTLHTYCLHMGRIFPKYSKHSVYKGPKSDNDSPYQYARETDSPFFPWLEVNPPNRDNFGQFMSAYRPGKPS
jgi:hypothetical protein